jgi:hypothetical protein
LATTPTAPPARRTACVRANPRVAAAHQSAAQDHEKLRKPPPAQAPSLVTSSVLKTGDSAPWRVETHWCGPLRADSCEGANPIVLRGADRARSRIAFCRRCDRAPPTAEKRQSDRRRNASGSPPAGGLAGSFWDRAPASPVTGVRLAIAAVRCRWARSRASSARTPFPQWVRRARQT